VSGRFHTAAIAPWTGLFVGAAAWFADHQLSSDGNFWDCGRAGGPFAVVVGLVCLAIAVTAGVVSWRVAPDAPGAADETRRLARVVGAAAAAIFALAIAFGTLAGVLLPGCQR
jgi:hypothetical protein